MTLFRALRRFAYDRRGTAAIEFAFVIVPTMLLMFGSIEVSRLMWTQSAIHEIAIAGARCMAVESTECADGSGVDLSATGEHIRDLGRSWGLTIMDSEIELNIAAGCGETAGFSSVIIDHQFTSVLTLLSGPHFTFEACFPNQN